MLGRVKRAGAMQRGGLPLLIAGALLLAASSTGGASGPDDHITLGAKPGIGSGSNVVALGRKPGVIRRDSVVS